MASISITQSGNTDKLDRFLKNMSKGNLFDALETFGQQGVAALEQATPRDTGATAWSWYYVIKKTPSGASISWHNSNTDSTGTPIIVMLQYGHGTGTGGWVPGRDFVNPAIDPIFNEAINAVWKAVQS